MPDNHPVDLNLQKPDLLDEDAWRAVEQHRNRLATAITLKDAPLIIGSAKELVECVARVVGTVKGTITPSNADFTDVVNGAHIALARARCRLRSSVCWWHLRRPPGRP